MLVLWKEENGALRVTASQMREKKRKGEGGKERRAGRRGSQFVLKEKLVGNRNLCRQRAGAGRR